MASSRFIALEQRLKQLSACFIIEKADYSQYTRDDHDMALAYLLLASAAIEDFVEQRCLEVATTGCDRFGKGQPTTAGRSVLEWYILVRGFRNASYATIPVDDRDLQNAKPLLGAAVNAFGSEVKRVHGMNGGDFQRLARPVGLRDGQFAEVLLDSLDSLAARRDPASHTPVKRAKSLSEPKAERVQVEQILDELRIVDEALEVLLTTYPV